MNKITVYHLKIKIVSLHFNIRAISNRLQCLLLLGDQQVDTKQMQVKHGLLNSNVTLQCEVSQKQINLFKEIQITLTEQDTINSDLVGNILLTFQEFKNIKMRKLPIRNCFDSSAYLEAFLLLLPAKLIDQPIEYQQQQLISTNLSLTQTFHSILKDRQLTLINEASNLSQQEITLNELPTRMLTVQDMTPENMEYDAPPQKQCINTESLIILNEILTEANNQLQRENKLLRQKLLGLEAKLSQPNYHSSQEQIQQINLLKLKLKTYEHQLHQKINLLAGIQKEKNLLKAEIQQLNKFLQAKHYLKNDNIMSQLGRCSETVKKYKSKGDSTIKIQQKLTTIPKIPSVILKKEFFSKQGSKTNRSSKKIINQARKLPIDEFKNDDTFDTLKQSSAFTIGL